MSYNIEETDNFIKDYWKLQKQEQVSKPLEKKEKNKNLEGFFDFVRKTKVKISKDGGKNKVPCSPKRTNLKHFEKSSSRSPDYFQRRKRLSPTGRPCHRSSKSHRYSSDSERSSSFETENAHRFSKSKSRARRSFSNRCRSHDSFSSSESESYCHSSNHQSHCFRHRLQHTRCNRSCSRSPYPHHQKSAKPYHKRERSSSRAIETLSLKSRPRVKSNTFNVYNQRSRLSRSYSPRESYHGPAGYNRGHQRHRSPSFERWSRSPARRDDVQGKSFEEDLAGEVKRQKTERESLSRYLGKIDAPRDTFQGKAREDKLNAGVDKGYNKRKQEEFIKTMNLKKKIKKWILSNDEGLASNMPEPSYRNPNFPRIKKEQKDCREKSSRDAFLEYYLDTSKGDFFCKLCDSHMNNIIMWEQHIRGQRHLKNVKKVPGERLSRMKSVKLPWVVSKLEERIEKEASDEIIVGLDFIRETRGSAGEIYNCFLCSSCSTNYDILQHLKLPKHRQNYLKQLKIERKSRIKEECYKMMQKYGRGKVEVYKSKN